MMSADRAKTQHQPHTGDRNNNNVSSIISSSFPNLFGQEIPDTFAQCIPFPFKLYNLLREAERDGLSGIVSWVPGNDNAFKIMDQKMFCSTFMKRYFKQTQYKSFQRQRKSLHAKYKFGFMRLLLQQTQ
jgi:hypothetical protein